MTPTQWRRFFQIAAQVCGKGQPLIELSESWCSWTTFERLGADAGYWTCGLPDTKDIKDTHIGDGGVWGQPFNFADLAHLIVPARFTTDAGQSRTQNIAGLAAELKKEGIPFRQNEVCLEIRAV